MDDEKCVFENTVHAISGKVEGEIDFTVSWGLRCPYPSIIYPGISGLFLFRCFGGPAREKCTDRVCIREGGLLCEGSKMPFSSLSLLYSGTARENYRFLLSDRIRSVNAS